MLAGSPGPGGSEFLRSFKQIGLYLADLEEGTALGVKDDLARLVKRARVKMAESPALTEAELRLSLRCPCRDLGGGRLRCLRVGFAHH